MSRALDGFFNSLYTQFLLRDLVAKVVPGFIALAAIVSLFWQRVLPFLDRLSGVHPLVTLGTLYAVSFMAGMLLQFVGQSLKLTVIHVWEVDGSSESRAKSLAKAKAFLRAAEVKDQESGAAIFRHRERFAILKEMSGNFGMSMLVIAFALFARSFASPYRLKFALLCAILLLTGIATVLFRQNRYHAKEQWIWENFIVPDKD